MSMEHGATHQNESKEVHKIPSSPARMIIDHLSFQESGTPEERLTRAENAFSVPNSQEVADALMELAHREGMERVVSLADKMKAAVAGTASALQMPMTALANDRSWAMWAIGRQYYYFKNPDQSGDEDRTKLADPMARIINTDGKEVIPPETEAKQKEMVNRHVAQLARTAYALNIHKWREKVDSRNSPFEIAKQLLRERGEEKTGKLPPNELSELGRQLLEVREKIEEKEAEDIAHATAEQYSLNPAMEDKEKEQKKEPKQKEKKQPEVPVQLHDGQNVHDKPAVKSAVTPWKLIKAGGLASLLIPGALAWVTVKEFAKTSWESVKGAFGVLKALAKAMFSFKAMASGVKVEAEKDAHGKDKGHGKDHAEHGHGDHDHGDHGHDDHGHDDHGHRHEKKKRWYARWWEKFTGGGDHGNGGGHGHGGGGHGGGHH